MNQELGTYSGSGWDIYRFDDKVDLEVTKCFALAVPYSIPVRKPFHHWALQFYDVRNFAWAADQLKLPSCKGMTVRSIGGLYYVGLRPTTKEEEKERLPLYRERMKPWVEDFGAMWRGKMIPEMMEHFNRLKETDLAALTDFQLMEHFEYYLKVKQRTWEIHFHPMYACFSAYREFRSKFEELFGLGEDSLEFKKLMTGFKTKIYEVDRQLWRLADRAKELGLEAVFNATPDDEDLMLKLEGGGNGNNWLREFHEFIQEHGWRTETLLDCCMPSWIQKPALALPPIRGNMAKRGGFVMDEEYKRLVKEREELEDQILDKVSASERENFRNLMKTAQWSGVYSEEHNYYVDCYMPALGRHILTEIGKRALHAGLLEDAEDINFLIPEEIITRVLANKETGFARNIVKKRKEEYQQFSENIPNMIEKHFLIGDSEWFFANYQTDPIMAVLVGTPKERPELKADLYGANSAPGSVEGIARVLLDVSQMSELQPGEILVVPSTNPSWHPAFNFVSGIVTDAGGALCHAIIVAKEYGLPCVAGTREGTTKIKTGNRIKVDGDKNAVYILG